MESKDADLQRLEADLERAIKDRDAWEERLDTLIYTLATVEEIGEWTSGNDPSARLSEHIEGKIQSLEQEYKTLRDRIEMAEALHRPLQIEPSETICAECSFRLPNGRFFGKVVEYPCATKLALGGEQ